MSISRISADGQVKVEWVDLGEGISDDYDPDNPEDFSLLRFDATITVGADHRFQMGGEADYSEPGWVTPQDSSYCTYVRADVPDAQLTEYAQSMADTLADALGAGTWKRTAEDLSWIGTSRAA